MSEEQRARPSCLAYTQQTWNEQNQNGDHAYDQGRWDPTVEQRTAAKLCGYSKSAWDNDKDVKNEQRTGAEMSNEQRAAPSCLGYTQQT